MKAIEFCYWLQGYFELSELPESAALQTKQIKCIRAHLALVEKVEPGHDNMFVEWLGSFLVNPPHSSGTAKIRRMLASQFKHVIDASHEGDSAALQAIHDGKPGTIPSGGVSPDVVYRC